MSNTAMSELYHQRRYKLSHLLLLHLEQSRALLQSVGLDRQFVDVKT